MEKQGGAVAQDQYRDHMITMQNTATSGNLKSKQKLLESAGQEASVERGEYNKNNHSPKKPKDREQSESHIPPADEEDGIPISTSGLLQVVERRQPLSSVSSLEVHFDLMDLTELADMSDQELAEVFADSDEESQPHDSPTELNQLYPVISHGTHLKSPSWTRAKSEQAHDRKHPNDPDVSLKMSDHLQTVEAHKKP